MKKRGIAILCTAAMLSGCLAGFSTVALADEPVEISYWTSSGSVEDRKNNEEMIQRFEEANPDIKVKYDGMAEEAYKTKIKTVIASNNLPDVFSYWVGEQFHTLINSGNVADLTDMYNEDTAFTDTFVPGSLIHAM